MAEQAASAVAAAVIGGVTDRALTTVMRKLRSRSRPAATDEKLQRLETLVLKLRSVIQVSERHAIESTSLLEWRDRLREAAAEGGAVVLDFQRRAREQEGGDAASASASAPGQQQPTAGALYFTRSALSGMAQRVRDATRRLFSTDEDMKKLDGALEKMKRLSPDITQFLLTLELEVCPRPKRRRAAVVTSKHDVSPKVGDMSIKRVADESATVQLASVPSWLASAEEARMLATKLEPTLRCLDSYIKATDGRDMGGLEWLAEWTALLREAVERGNAVLQTLRRGSDVVRKAGTGSVLALEEDGELYGFARAVEVLAREEPLFAALANLCPWKQ